MARPFFVFRTNKEGVSVNFDTPNLFYYSQLIKSASLEFFQFVGKQFKGVAHCLMLAWTCTTAEFLE